MKTMNKSGWGIILLAVLLIQVASAQTYSIQLEKDRFTIGETVYFEIGADDNSVVEVVSPTNVYKLFGDSSGTHAFLATEAGIHKIVILKKESTNEIESRLFEVVDSTNNGKIITDKEKYMINDVVSITFNSEFSIDKEYSLSISSDNSYYSFIGTPDSEITFVPDSIGTYNIGLIDLSSGETFSKTFSVQAQNPSLKNSGPKVPRIKDSKGNEESLRVKFRDINNLEVHPEELKDNEMYDVEFELKSSVVNRIRLKGYKAADNLQMGLEDVSNKEITIEGKKSLKSYAIDISFNFTNGTATSVARGTELYKCQEWNFNLQTCTGSWVKFMDLIPGEEYNIPLYPGDPGFAETGVASVNTNQSIFRPGQVAEVIMVVLDNEGYLVSNAKVDLVITNPANVSSNYSTVDSTIVETSRGIYKAYYPTTIAGLYRMQVIATGLNVDNNMSSYFYVMDYFEFDIIRSTPVTIDPFKGPFTSSIKIWSLTNDEYFNFSEKLPVNFTITDAGGSVIRESGSSKYLDWFNIQNGTTVQYIANSPLMTPELWEVGPAYIDYRGGTFYEARPWFLAVDPSYYYDPNSTISSGWTWGTGTTYQEIDDAVRFNTPPNTNDYLQSQANDLTVAEYGFPNVTQDEIDNITLWVYTGTGNNAQYTFSLRQGVTTQCSDLRTPNSATQWYSCTWQNPTGDLSDLRVNFGGVSKVGGGKNSQAYVYAAYIEVYIANLKPSVGLNYPGDASEVNVLPVDFNFTPDDAEDTTLTNCSLWGNFSGSWALEATKLSPSNGSINNITVSPGDGEYEWNVECFDSGDKGAFAPANYTVKVNSVVPAFNGAALNTSVINQSKTVRFNVSITDYFGISQEKVTLRYPNGTRENYSLSNTGSEYYYIFTDTTQTGFYNVTLAWANDSLNQEGTFEPSNLFFEVTVSPPSAFDLVAPANDTISNNLLPIFSWQQTVEANFDNYTLIIDKDQGFGSPDFVYNTFEIDNTSYKADFALDGNSVYYWRVIAYDTFGSSTNSISDFIYRTDNNPPSVILISPADNDYLTVTGAEFNFTPSETYNLDTCVLYADFSGSFGPNETLKPVTNNQNNSIYTTITADGTYEWNVLCNDSATNEGFAISNRTLIADFTGPTINLVSPANNTYENETNLVVFVANSSDALANTDSCDIILNGLIEDTKSVNDDVNFNFTKFVSNGQYNWSVNCTDTNGWQSSSYIYNLTVEVVDNDPPLVTLNYPGEGQFLAFSNVSFNYTPEDATGIENCSVYIDGTFNESNQSVVNFVPNYFDVANLAHGNHNWTVECVDNSTEFNSFTAEVFYFTVDLDVPAIGLHAPENNSFRGTNVTFNYTPTDSYLDSCALYGNFTGSWVEDQVNSSVISGQYNYFEKTLNDGIYFWNVWCNDSAGTNNVSSYNYTLNVDSTPPQYSNIIISPSSPVQYGSGQDYYFNITWTDNFGIDDVIFEHNFSGSLTNVTLSDAGSGVYNYSVADLSAGSYYYKWYANDTRNNLNETSALTYSVTKAQSSVNVLLNGSNSNFSMSKNAYVNITGVILTPSSGNIELYLGGVLINNGASPLENVTLFENPGVYNVTAKYYGNVNYNPSSDTRFILINDTINPNVSLMSPVNESSVSSGDILLEYNVTDSSTIVNCSIYINDSLENTNYSVSTDTPQSFSINRPTGSYLWNILCFDVYNNSDWSESRVFNAIDTDSITVNVSTNDYYERGELATISTITDDVFGLPLVTNVISDVILGNATVTWWNTAWNKRKPVYMNETGGLNRSGEFAVVNVTGLSNNISSCLNEIRVIHQTSSVIEELPLRVINGDDANWCYITFKANISADAVDENNYYVYYNNTVASNPGYSFDTTVNYVLNATLAATDEGDPTTISNIIGDNDATSAQMTVSGGGATADSAHGRGFILENSSKVVEKVEVRYRYEVTSCSTNWYLRYSVNDGGAYSNSLTGGTTVAKTTSAWFDISSAFSTLNWIEVNRTRLQGRVNKPGGGGGCTQNLYWVEMNVTARIEANITDTMVGETNQFIERSSGPTDVAGLFDWGWNTNGNEYGNYSAVSLAYKSSYTNNTGFKLFELVPDTTDPNVTLLTPSDLQEVGTGSYNFTYSPYDINLDNCTLYIEDGGSYLPNQTDQNPVNNQSNGFNAVYLGLGLHDWNVLCFDTLGNNAFAIANFTLNITGPDLTVTTNDVYFGSEDILENNNLTLYANISNIGLSDANESFYVQFFLGDPDAGGNQIGGDIFIQNLSFGSNITVSMNHTLISGPNDIFVRVDPYGDIAETDENNNKANRTVHVELYQYFYGDVINTLVLGDNSGLVLIDFNNYTEGAGNIYFADSDSSFSFTDLKALTRNSNGNPVINDFSEFDTIMNTTVFNDSIKRIWGGDTDTPLKTDSFNISGIILNNVPIVNSTNSSSFITGILWDLDDDLSSNLQFDSTDGEDVIFVTKINRTTEGRYGTYDYEVKIPATLRDYKVGVSKIVFYTEII